MRQQPLGSMLVGMLNFVRWRYQASNFPYMLAEAVSAIEASHRTSPNELKPNTGLILSEILVSICRI